MVRTTSTYDYIRHAKVRRTWDGACVVSQRCMTLDFFADAIREMETVIQCLGYVGVVQVNRLGDGRRTGVGARPWRLADVRTGPRAL